MIVTIPTTIIATIDNKTIGNRPVIKYSLIEKYCNTDVMDDGTLLAYFGKYPQNVVNNEFSVNDFNPHTDWPDDF